MTRIALGVVLVLVGALLALVLPELRFLWFEGRPLGILLVIVGVVEGGEAFLRARRQGTAGEQRS